MEAQSKTKKKCKNGCLSEGASYYYYGTEYVLCEGCQAYMIYRFEHDNGFRTMLADYHKKDAAGQGRSK